MNRIRPRAAALCAIAASGIVTAAVLPASAASARTAAQAPASAASAACQSATLPKLATRISRGIRRALAGRDSDVGLAVADPRFGLSCAINSGGHFDAASAIKVTIISALLLKEHGYSHLTAAQRHLAWLMITESDNDAATALWNDVGMRGMQRFLNKAGMRHTILNQAWGLTELTAQDELTLLGVLTSPGRLLSARSRGYVLSLMAHVEAGQRWGVPAGAPASVRVSVKNGWLPYPDGDDWHVNSIGAFLGRDVSYRIVVLTSGDPDEAYGIDTIEAAARVINRDIAKG
jgi:beta-lactamase class A